MSWLSRLRGIPHAAPEVLLDVECEDGCLILVLINVGNRPAFEVRVDFDPPIVGLDGGKVISDLSVFHRLQLLRAGREIRVFLDSAPLFFARGDAIRFEASVSWRNRRGRVFSAKYPHDLEVYRDLVTRI